MSAPVKIGYCRAVYGDDVVLIPVYKTDIELPVEPNSYSIDGDDREEWSLATGDAVYTLPNSPTLDSIEDATLENSYIIDSEPHKIVFANIYNNLKNKSPNAILFDSNGQIPDANYSFGYNCYLFIVYSTYDKCYYLVNRRYSNASLNYQFTIIKIRSGYENSEYYTIYDWTDKILNIPLVPLKTPVNFYRAYPEGDISLNRGESVTFKYNLVYDDGTTEEWDDVIYEYTFSDRQATLNKNTLTISDTAGASFVDGTARPNLYGIGEEYDNLFSGFYVTINDPKDAYEDGGTSGPGGGDGLFGEGELSDIIFNDIPNGSSESDISSSGLFTRYIMSRSTVKSFGDWLFSDNIIDTIVKEFMALIFASPMEAIISMISYPFSIGSLPGIGSVASNVYYGNKDSGIASLGRMTNGFASIDWGTVAIAEYWGNFLDYSPHTKIELYLPWSTGFVDIDPNDVMDSTISIITNIELDKGTCVHNVYNGRGAVIGQYSGVCGKQLPITALDTSGKALSATVAAVATAVSVGAAGVTAAGAAATESAAVGALRSAKAMGLSTEAQWTAAQSMRGLMSRFHKDYTPVAKAGSKVAAVSALAAARIPPHIQRSGSFTGNGSGLGVQYPYFILSRPDQSVPEQYGSYVGYPSNIYASLGSLKGYTEVGSIFLDGVACTENERAEIDSLLKGGVIL